MPRKAKPAAEGPAGLDCYRPAERRIYRYWDGAAERAADPLELEDGLHGRGGRQWAEDLATLQAAARISESPVGSMLAGPLAEDMARRTAEAVNRTVELVRGVFGVAPLADGGLTRLECVDLLTHFLAYQARLAESFRPLATSPSPTASRDSADDPATPPSAASSGTESGTSSASATASPRPS